MAKYRETPCEFYVCINLCKKDRKAEHNGYCQKCELYKPRCKERHLNKKKEKLEKIRKIELQKCEE